MVKQLVFDIPNVVQFFLTLSFLLYGASCFLSKHIFQEFHRYGMSQWREFTGALQLASCVGLGLGFYLPYFTSLATLILTVMMLVALTVRWRLRDSLLMTAPAAIYFLLSLFLFIHSINLVI